jgi:hypothetical protein
LKYFIYSFYSSETICSKHASADEYKCPFCKELHEKPEKGYLKNNNLKIITEKFYNAKNLLNKLNSSVQLIKNIQESDGDFFKDELSKVKNQIFNKKEQTKQILNDMIEASYLELIAEIETREKILDKTLADRRNIKENELNKIEEDVQRWKDDLDAIKISEHLWEEIEKQYPSTSSRLESFKSSFTKSVDQLDQNKICTFIEKNITIDKIELGEIISQNKSAEMDTSDPESQESEDKEEQIETLNQQNEEMMDKNDNFEKQVRTKGHMDKVNCAKFDRSGKFIITVILN